MKIHAFEGDSSETQVRRVLHHTSGLPMYWKFYYTAHDLALFSLLHLGRLQPDQKAVLKPESIRAMQRSRDPDVRTSSYALGWETGRRFGYPIIAHGEAKVIASDMSYGLPSSIELKRAALEEQ